MVLLPSAAVTLAVVAKSEKPGISMMLVKSCHFKAALYALLEPKGTYNLQVVILIPPNAEEVEGKTTGIGFVVVIVVNPLQ